MPSPPPSKDSKTLRKEADGASVAVVIPCHRETAHILDVLGAIGPAVERIFVVDDGCPDRTGEFVRANSDDPRVQVLVHERNTGVGGATVTGYRAAIESGSAVIVKLDGDGQMDPALISTIAEPVIGGRADYAKGNRFHQLDSVSEMPAVRLIGNLGLSLASKVSSGYWDIFDPTNGFTAIHASVAARLPLESMSKGYFFESDMLFRLGMLRAVVADVPMRARYGKEQSGIQLHKILPEFSFRHFVNTIKRVYFTYFLRDVSAATVQLVFGNLLFWFGVVFGLLEWFESRATGVPATAGTVILAALPIIVGSQLLISFVNHDTRNVPSAPIQQSDGS